MPFTNSRKRFLHLVAIAGVLATHMVARATDSQADRVPCETDPQSHIEICRNVAFSSGENPLRLDLYKPAKARAPRQVLVVHGGCFIWGDKGWMEQQARRFAAAGFAALVPDYTLAHEKPYPAALQDLFKAVEWAQGPGARLYSLDPSRIAAYGESAGATLASYLGTRPLPGGDPSRAAVSSVIDFYGRTDFTRPQPATGNDCAQEFLGPEKSRTENPDAFVEASVAPRPGVKPAEFLIAHGTEDQQVEPYHSLRLRDLLIRSGLRDGREVVYKEVSGSGHGFEGEPAEETWGLAFKFLSKDQR